MIAQLDADYLRIRPAAALPRLLAYFLYEGRPITTRGRWINPLVLRWLAAHDRFGVRAPVDRPVFIVGTGRSGTTATGRLLSLHPAVAFLNEPKAVWHTIHPHEDLAGNYGDGAARWRLGAEEATPERVRLARRIAATALALTRASRLVDKYPELAFRIDFVRRIFPDAIFIAPVRDGWATVRSVALWSARKGSGAGSSRVDWWGVGARKWRLLVSEIAAAEPDFAPHVHEILALREQTDRAALEWLLTMRVLLRRRDDADIRLLSWESLTADPAAGARALLHAAELDEHPAVIEYARRTLRSAASAEPVPLHPLLDSPFRDAVERIAALAR